MYVQTSGTQDQSTQQNSEAGSNDTIGGVSTGSLLSEGKVTPQPEGECGSLTACY